MAIDWKRTRFEVTLEERLASGASVVEEGTLLARIAESNVKKVKPAVADDKRNMLDGFALLDTESNSTRPNIEVVTIPSSSPFTVLAAKTNLVSIAFIRVKPATGDDFTNVGANPAATQYAVDIATGIFTFASADAGKSITLYYRYNLTVEEARRLYYQRSVNNEANAFLAQLSVGKGHLVLFTSMFDTGHQTNNWAIGNRVKSAANGILAPGSLAADALAITDVDAIVISIPTVDDPWLGVEGHIG